MDLYAYYPYAENADPTALVYDASVAEADFMTARTPGFSERDGEIRLVFRHKLALAEAFVADADKLADYAVTVQDVRTKAVFSLAAAAQDAEMQSVDAKTASVAMTRCGNAFRAYLPAQEIAEGKALLKVEGNGFAAFDYTHPGKTSLAANQVRKLLVTPAFANPELLPNCYVVSPGETLYIPVSKAFGVWGKNDVLAGEGAGMLGAMGARVVWEDVRYLLNGDGNCYWSWHIWATEYDPSQVAGQQTVGGNVFMDRNLGATSLVKGPQSAGCFYQWGRKDPFCGGTAPETSATAFAQAAENSVVNPAFADTHAWKQESGAAVSTLEYAAAHPLSFLSNKGATGVYDWLAKPRADLWNTAKTCYDPCPVGYKVPDRDTWDDFADDQDRYVDGTSEWDGEKYGMTYIFGDLRDWYPTSGYRNRDKGNLAGLATTRTGHYWSNYRSGNTISCFYISKKLSTGKLLQPQSSSKSDAAYGYNVRCCRE